MRFRVRPLPRVFVALVLAVAAATALLARGAPPAAAEDAPVSLASGWNNVPYLGETLPVDDALNNAAPDVLAVWEWVAPFRLWRAYVPSDALLSDLVVLTPGRAYWVRAARAVDWLQPSEIQFSTGHVELVTAGGGNYPLAVELADTAAERSRGLMFRQSLEADAGMLFLFPGDAQGGFWMQNTYVPLSIAFIDADGRIVDLLDMMPLTLTINTPRAPYRWALEVNQGWFGSHGVAPGDAVRLVGR